MMAGASMARLVLYQAASKFRTHGVGAWRCSTAPSPNPLPQGEGRGFGGHDG